MDRLRLISFRQWAVLSCVAIAFLTAAFGGPVQAANGRTTGTQTGATHATVAHAALVSRRVVLVVGDSLVEQSESALKAASTSTVDVRVVDRLGTAPCDWTGGELTAAMLATHPAVVVLAFAGNAGAAAGCVGNAGPRAYPLKALVDNYRTYLAQLAEQATAAGAAVAIATAPARNPAAAAPPATPTAAERQNLPAYYGFQGVPELRRLYTGVVSASGGRWHLSNAAALAVSPDFTYVTHLACASIDTGCENGTVRVRTGGTDAIHLDPEGNGAKRYAAGLLSAALQALPTGAPTGI